MRRFAFTLMELIFVIVIMGILSKFGVEFLAQAYNSYILSSINNSLQANSAAAVETIASKLQYRIKDSVIARRLDNTFVALAGNTDPDIPILEWVGSDIEGFRGNTAVLPHWSGIIDLDLSSSTTLVSPGTDTGAVNTLIGVLSNAGSGINNAALYFVGSDSDIQTGYGWDSNALNTQNATMHPIRRSTVVGEENLFIPRRGDNAADNNFTGVDVYEYYQLAWTAYAVGIDNYDDDTKTGTLTLWYDYQPWQGESYTDGKSAVIMDDVSTFQFMAIGSIVKIQVCVNSDLVEDYSLCKEKTIF